MFMVNHTQDDTKHVGTCTASWLISLSCNKVRSIGLQYFSAKNLYNLEGEIASLHELFSGTKPTISQYIVFGCPAVALWVVTIDGRETIHCTEKGIREIFIGFPPNQKGYRSIYQDQGQSLYQVTRCLMKLSTQPLQHYRVDLKMASHYSHTAV